MRFSANDWMEASGINLWDSDARQRIERLQWKIAQEFLILGRSVVIEWGTWRRSERDVLRTTARGLGAAVELHFLDAPVEVLFDRIHQRNMERPPITLEQMQEWRTCLRSLRRRRWRCLTRLYRFIALDRPRGLDGGHPVFVFANGRRRRWYSTMDRSRHIRSVTAVHFPGPGAAQFASLPNLFGR
jgi:hypothetical protein